MSEEMHIRVKLEDTVYDFYPMRLTPLDVSAMRRETGFTMPKLFEAVQAEPDIDVLAVLVWLARRTAGERMLKFETVANTITYESQFDFIEDEDATGTDLPE